MKMKNLYYCLGMCSLVVLLTACHKDSKRVAPAQLPDTLTQSIYTINSGGSSAPATILCAPFYFPATPFVDSPGLLLMMDQDGKVLKKVVTDGTAFGFNRWNYGGKTRYSYFVNDVSAFRYPGTANFVGYAVVADSALNEITRFNFIPSGPGPYYPGQALDVHDFILLADDHYIAMTYYVKAVTNIPAYLNPSPNVVVQVPLIQEVNKGAVVWQWDASLDTSFYANSVEGNSFSDSSAQDYMHMNGMCVDPRDNNLICSFRNQDQIIKINRQTGAILWRLGGKNSDFPLYSDQVFLRQHFPSLTDNGQTLMIFDNGLPEVRPESRILEFKLDEANKKVISFKSYSIPEPWSQLMGSVQKDGDEYFIGGGTAGYMLEVNYVTGQILKEFKGGSYITYRAYRFPDKAN